MLDKKANEIVSLIKDMSIDIMSLFDNKSIDFIGCSSLYCEEKINYLSYQLKFLKKYLKQKDKEQQKERLTK
jgi:hypothetical protein